MHIVLVPYSFTLVILVSHWPRTWPLNFGFGVGECSGVTDFNFLSRWGHWSCENMSDLCPVRNSVISQSGGRAVYLSDKKMERMGPGVMVETQTDGKPREQWWWANCGGTAQVWVVRTEGKKAWSVGTVLKEGRKDGWGRFSQLQITSHNSQALYSNLEHCIFVWIFVGSSE